VTNRVDVILESECSAADLTAVAEVFKAAGISAEVRAAYVRESAGDLPWIILVGLPLWAGGVFLGAALQGAGDEAGRAGWRALMRLVRDLYEARKASRAPEGTVSLGISDPLLEIPLPPDLPDVAYRHLCEIEEPRAMLSGILMWDNKSQAWTDARAAKYRCDYPPDCYDWATQGRVHQSTGTSFVRREFCDVHAAAADTGDPQAWA